MRKEPSLFISYNHANKQFVRKLSNDLENYQVDVWLDETELRVGDSLITRISAAIDGVDYLGVVLTRQSVRSAWVQEELQQAIDLKLRGKSIVILPILLEDCEMPAFLRSKVYADFRDENNYNEALSFLVSSMRLQKIKILKGVNRPYEWYCSYCGAFVTIKWGYSNPVCPKCYKHRAYYDSETTSIECSQCRQIISAGSTYCEWCGSLVKK